jgi:S1-C subfamily serine protease
VADELGLPASTQGVAITKLEGGPAKRFFKKGDIVLEINGVVIDSVEALRSVLKEDARIWRIAVDRGGRVLKIAVGG